MNPEPPSPPPSRWGPSDSEADPGAEHLVGTGIGAAGGAAAGAALGSVAGPGGALIGGAVGAVLGGVAGRGVAAVVNPEAEESYWRDRFRDEPYYQPDFTYEDYRPAFRWGIDHYQHDTTFEDIENDLANRWDEHKGESRLTWEEARPAVQASWNHLAPTFPPA